MCVQGTQEGGHSLSETDSEAEEPGEGGEADVTGRPPERRTASRVPFLRVVLERQCGRGRGGRQ